VKARKKPLPIPCSASTARVVAHWLERDYTTAPQLLFPESEAENRGAATRLAEILRKRARSARSSPCVSMQPELADWLSGFWFCLFMGWPGHSATTPTSAVFELARRCYEVTNSRAGRPRLTRDQLQQRIARLTQLTGGSPAATLTAHQVDKELNAREAGRRHARRLRSRERFHAQFDSGRTLLTG
jgi:hypothetical protein